MDLDPDPSWHLQSEIRPDLWVRDLLRVRDHTTPSSLPDSTSVSLHPGRTDIPDKALTHSHQALFLRMSLPLTALLCLPTDTQGCLCLDPWGGSLALDLPTDTYTNPDWALALQLIHEAHHHHTSVRLHRIILDRCLRHSASEDPWDPVRPSLLTCASQDQETP